MAGQCPNVLFAPAFVNQITQNKTELEWNFFDTINNNVEFVLTTERVVSGNKTTLEFSNKTEAKKVALNLKLMLAKPVTKHTLSDIKINNSVLKSPIKEYALTSLPLKQGQLSKKKQLQLLNFKVSETNTVPFDFQIVFKILTNPVDYHNFQKDVDDNKKVLQHLKKYVCPFHDIVPSIVQLTTCNEKHYKPMKLGFNPDLQNVPHLWIRFVKWMLNAVNDFKTQNVTLWNSLNNVVFTLVDDNANFYFKQTTLYNNVFVKNSLNASLLNIAFVLDKNFNITDAKIKEQKKETKEIHTLGQYYQQYHNAWGAFYCTQSDKDPYEKIMQCFLDTNELHYKNESRTIEDNTVDFILSSTLQQNVNKDLAEFKYVENWVAFRDNLWKNKKKRYINDKEIISFFGNIIPVLKQFNTDGNVDFITRMQNFLQSYEDTGHQWCAIETFGFFSEFWEHCMKQLYPNDNQNLFCSGRIQEQFTWDTQQNLEASIKDSEETINIVHIESNARNPFNRLSPEKVYSLDIDLDDFPDDILLQEMICSYTTGYFNEHNMERKELGLDKNLNKYTEKERKKSGNIYDQELKYMHQTMNLKKEITNVKLRDVTKKNRFIFDKYNPILQVNLASTKNYDASNVQNIIFTKGKQNKIDRNIVIQGNEYILTSAASHLGQGSQSGHFVCYIRSGNTFYEMNDSSAKKIKEKDLDITITFPKVRTLYYVAKQHAFKELFIPRGIKNARGQDCYLNASLQCFMALTPFWEKISHIPVFKGTNLPVCLSDQFSTLVDSFAPTPKLSDDHRLACIELLCDGANIDRRSCTDDNLWDTNTQTIPYACQLLGVWVIVEKN